MKTNNLPVVKEDVDMIGEYQGIQDVYESFNKVRKEITEVENVDNKNIKQYKYLEWDDVHEMELYEQKSTEKESYTVRLTYKKFI